MKTRFTEKFRKKSDAELQDYLDNGHLYQKEAVLTAIHELESRGNRSGHLKSVKSELSKELPTEKRETVPSFEYFEKPAEVPRTIVTAANMLYASVIFGLINPIFAHFLTPMDNSHPVIVITVLLSSGILAFLAYLIHRGKDWARYLLTTLIGLGLLMFPFIIPDTFAQSFVVGIFSVIQAVLQGYAVILLFQRDSRNWYNRRNK